MKNKITLDSIIIFLFKGLVVILPLFFLPWTASRFGMDNFNKGYLLWVLIPLIFFLWLGRGFKRGEFKVLKSPINIPLVLLICAYSLAAIFSLDFYSSLFGSYGIYTGPVLTFASMVLMYFFITGYLKGSDITKIINAVILSFIFIVSITFLLFLGSWIFNLNSNSMFNQFFVMLAGGFEDLAIYLSVINILIIGILYSKQTWRLVFKKNWQRRIIIIALGFSFFFLIIINFPPSWWLLFFGMVFLFIVNRFYLKIKFKKKRTVVLYFLSILLLLVFITINLFVIDNNVFHDRRTAKLQLDFSNSYKIAKEALKKKPVFGYGPETFSYVFSLFRDSKINSADYWHLRFNKPASSIIDLVITTGVIGALSYTVFILLILYLFFVFLNYFRNNRNEPKEGVPHEHTAVTGMMAVVLVLIMGQFFVIINITLIFLFWLFLSLLAVIVLGIKGEADDRLRLNFKLIKINKILYPNFFKVLVLIIFLAVSGWIALLTLEVKYWVAEAYFSKGNKSEDSLVKAVTLNPKRVNYKVALAKFYKEKAITELEKPDKNIELTGELVNKSIDWARLAVKEAPFSVAANETLGMTYRDISSYSEDSLPFAIEAFKNARKLEPTNPVLSTELGKLYLDSGVTIEAISALEEASQLKENYFEAEFNLAKAYSLGGRDSEALIILDKITKEYSSADVFYERGKIYYNTGNYNQAIMDFEEVLNLSPDHSNALFSIGLAFEEIGEEDRALDFFKKVLDLNPGNEEIMGKIKDLEKE